MATPDSEEAPVFGAVFGITENIDTAPAAPQKRPPPRSLASRDQLKATAQTKQALMDRGGANARKKRRQRRQRGLPKELLVTEKHLGSFDSLHALLQNFQDPFASGSELKKHIEEIPVLAGRLLRTARITTGQMDMNDIGVALSLMGNKALEQELLQFLEDMTEVKADWEEKNEKKGAL